MFGLFDKKKPEAKAYHKSNDLGEAGYREAIALLAKTSEPEWLASTKMNAAILLSSLDLGQALAKDGKPSERVRKMIDGMTEAEYSEWVKTVVFH